MEDGGRKILHYQHHSSFYPNARKILIPGETRDVIQNFGMEHNSGSPMVNLSTKHIFSDSRRIHAD
jgi:hypothetical protein